MPTRDVKDNRPSAAIEAMQTLRDIRAGKLPNDTKSGGVRLLTHVAYDKATGCAFYYLTGEARALLRDGRCLPWGSL